MKIKNLLIIGLLINPPAIYAGLNDTGITTCSNATQNGLPCPVAGFPGQDAEYGTNSFDFTKLDANGTAMAVTATNHSCVQDNVTGLIWEVNTYTATFDTAPQLATQANADNRCGHKDWRMPDIKELSSIVDYSIPYPGPTIDTDYFPNTPARLFWSASPHASFTGGAWLVYFSSGDGGNDFRTYTLHARLVCAGQSLSFVFTDNANGTITDSSTGLIWAKCPLGQSGANCEIGSASMLTWAQALNAAKNSSLAGRNDWRVPNIQELRSIVDYTKYNPSINITYFPNTPTKWFWSASPYAYSADDAWIVEFYDGYDYYYLRTYTGRARLVCAGQVLSFALNVAKTGNGAGSISSNPAGINCGVVCAANFAQNSSVTLTAAPNTGSAFAGWSGDADCSDGTVTMDAAKNCTATFNLSITVPTATTGAASNITQTSATLNGTVLSSGATATVSFDFGKDTSRPSPLPLTREGGKESYYSPLQSWGGVGGGVKSFTYTETIAATPSTVYSNTAVAVSANKTGLTCNTTYHYRVTAVNSAGTSRGGDKTFTTAACAPINSWLYPVTLNIARDREFNLNVIAKSDGMYITNYEFILTFDPTKLSLIYNPQCNNFACPGANALSYHSVYLVGTNAIKIIGLGGQTIAGNDLQLLIIKFKTQTTLGVTNVELKTNSLVNTSGMNIGLGTRGATINISSGICGDANGDTTVNIIDALAIGRKLVGLPPPPTIEPLWANVNTDNNVTIIDALHISRFAIGLVLPPEICNIGQPL